MTPGPLEAQLRARRDEGRKLLVPYVTGGVPGWPHALEAVAQSGADAIEVGIPFSDPVMDGPVVQAASQLALDAGATPPAIVDELARIDAGVPLAVMTYYNPVFRAGEERFAHSLAEAGVAGAIIPDLPLEESPPWTAAADAAGVETVLLAAPTATDERLVRICDRSRGFVYAVALLGVTGEREALAATARSTARRLKAVTDLPVLVGVGISTAAHAVEACRDADGVVIGSAVVRRLLDEDGPDAAAQFVAEVRDRLDGGPGGG